METCIVGNNHPALTTGPVSGWSFQEFSSGLIPALIVFSKPAILWLSVPPPIYIHVAQSFPKWDYAVVTGFKPALSGPCSQ